MQTCKEIVSDLQQSMKRALSLYSKVRCWKRPNAAKVGCCVETPHPKMQNTVRILDIYFALANVVGNGRELYISGLRSCWVLES